MVSLTNINKPRMKMQKDSIFRRIKWMKRVSPSPGIFLPAFFLQRRFFSPSFQHSRERRETRVEPDPSPAWFEKREERQDSSQSLLRLSLCFLYLSTALCAQHYSSPSILTFPPMIVGPEGYSWTYQSLGTLFSGLKTRQQNLSINNIVNIK